MRPDAYDHGWSGRFGGVRSISGLDSAVFLSRRLFCRCPRTGADSFALCTAAHGQPPPLVVREADYLRGNYGPHCANNDLLYYHLDVRVGPVEQFLSGKNTVRTRTLEHGTRLSSILYQRTRSRFLVFLAGWRVPSVGVSSMRDSYFQLTQQNQARALDAASEAYGPASTC